MPILFAQSFTMCQIDFSVMQSPMSAPFWGPCERSCPGQFQPPAATRPTALSPSRGSEPFGRVLPCPPNRQSPSVLRVAVGHQSSGQRLHAVSTHTPAATQEVLGPAFLLAPGYLALAKECEPALPSTSFQGEHP